MTGAGRRHQSAQTVLDLIVTLAIYGHGAIRYGWQCWQRRRTRG